jgi:serine/threonine protein kinase
MTAGAVEALLQVSRQSTDPFLPGEGEGALARRGEAVENATTVERMPPDASLVLDRYRLVRKLGAGGFGTVWLAHDERLDRRVAVKRIPNDGGENPRAEREALAAARLSHPGIVALYEAGHDEDAWYLVSELVRGSTLGELERDGALSDRDVVRIGIALCDALEHAHARGVIHRDVKPGNVMVPEQIEDGAGLAKLTDFGIARLADAGALTGTGDVIGTIAYMAPEQAEGRRVTAAADLYALALVLYEALSGTNPVRAEGAAATARRVGMHLPPLRRLRRDLPRALCEALDAAVCPDPEERGTVADLRAALDATRRDVDDEPGLVTAGTIELATQRTRVWRRDREDREADRLGEPTRQRLPEADEADERRRSSIPGRVIAGVGAAGLSAWALERLPLEVAAAGPFLHAERLSIVAGIGIAVALLPRLAWLVAAAIALVAVGPDRTAVIVAAAIVPVVVLAPGSPTLWSLPAAAPALHALGLAGAYPALAGLARGWATRVALGALGLWWLVLGETILTAHPTLAGATDPGVFALAALWGTAAGVLPLLVRGARAQVDLVAAVAWAVGLSLATPAVAEALSVDAPSGTALGAALGAAVVMAARAVAPRT